MFVEYFINFIHCFFCNKNNRVLCGKLLFTQGEDDIPWILVDLILKFTQVANNSVKLYHPMNSLTEPVYHSLRSHFPLLPIVCRNIRDLG